MDRLLAKKKLTIVRLYLSGLSYDEIVAKTHVSKGTVANVVADLKAGRFPEATNAGEDVELLRELSLDLKRSRLTVGQCTAGLSVLTRINECGLDPTDIDRWPLILKSIDNEDEAQGFVRLVYSIQEVQKRTGLDLDALDNKVHELEKKAADLKPMSRQREECRKQLAKLTRQRKELASAVANLEEKYKLLNPRVKDLEEREQYLSQRIKGMESNAERADRTLTSLSKEMQKLQNIGLPFEALAQFSERVQSVAQRQSITPAELRDRLLQELESLDQGLGLEALVKSRQLELEERERTVATAKEELETIKSVVSGLKQEKSSLEAGIRETRERVSREIAKIPPAARLAINQLMEELRRGNDEALAEAHRLGDKALEVGRQLGQYEAILRDTSWLNDLPALVRGEEGVEGRQVRTIVSSVVRGAAVWLKHHQEESPGLRTVLLAAENLIRELEQWGI